MLQSAGAPHDWPSVRNDLALPGAKGILAVRFVEPTRIPW